MKSMVGDFVQNWHFDVSKQNRLKSDASKQSVQASLECFDTDGW